MEVNSCENRLYANYIIFANYGGKLFLKYCRFPVVYEQSHLGSLYPTKTRDRH